MPNTASSVLLLIILCVVGAIVLVVDAVIFFRWIRHLWAMYDLQERRAQEAGALAGSLEAATLSVVAPDPRDDPEMPIAPFARTWSLVDPFVGFQAVFIVANVVIACAMLPLLFRNGAIHGVDVLSSAPGIIIQVIGLFFLNGLLVGVTAFYVHRYGTTLAAIGLRKPTVQLVGMGFGLGLVLFLLASGADIAMGAILPHLLPKAVMDGITQFTRDVTAGGMFTNIPSVRLKILFALAGAVAAPIGEEVFFRGLLYNALKRRLNVRAGIVISGLLFALVHFGPLAMIVIFPMGMLLAYVYEKTQSLWVTICMHATNNGLAFVIALYFPNFGEAPKEPVRPASHPAKPAIISAARSNQWGHAAGPRRGACIHG